MRRLRTATITLSAFFLGLAASACSSSEPDQDEICRDKVTGNRVADEECDDDDHHFVYVKHGHAPAVGHPIHSYSTVKTGVIGRAPAGGGKGTSSGS